MKDLIRSILKNGIFEPLWYRIVKDKPYGLWFTKLTPNHYSYQNPTIRKVERKGINYQLNLANIVDWNLYFGFKEMAKERLFNMDKSPKTIIDIGANIGEITLNFAKRYPEAKVHGFEPFPETFSILSKNIEFNKFDNLFVHNIGLGANEGEVLFEERQIGNPGMNRVTKNPEKSAVRVAITTLDIFLASNHISDISLIKLDVEGYEFEVLQGAKTTLLECKPKLFIELDDNNLKDQGSSAKDLIAFLNDLNYQIRNAETLEEISLESSLLNCHLDIICE